MNNRAAVILPLDGSETATVALGAAQAMATIMGAVLHIVHVAETRFTEDQLATELKIGSLVVKDFSLHQIVGDNPIDEILRFAASVDTQMIVMSTHGKTYNSDYILGSITTGIVQRSIDPVMLIRPGVSWIPEASWRPVKMLVPQNGTPAAASVMGQVFHLASLTGAEVDVLNIGVVGEKPPTEVGTMRTPMYMDYPRYDWPAWASEFAERFLTQRPADVKLHLFEREGEPASVIRDFAGENNDDLIVMGWHGQFGEGRARIVKDLLQTVELPLILIWSRE